MLNGESDEPLFDALAAFQRGERGTTDGVKKLNDDDQALVDAVAGLYPPILTTSTAATIRHAWFP